MYPRTQITITIQELHDDGCLLSACINATTLALTNAGIPMNSLIASCSVVLIEDKDKKESNLHIYNTKEEEQNARARFSITYDKSLKGPITTHTVGPFSQEEFWNVSNNIKTTCQQLLGSFRKVLSEHYSED